MITLSIIYKQIQTVTNQLKQFFEVSEKFRLFFLFFLIISIYYPFFTDANLGGLDAQWYQYLLHDSILQLKQGMFPTIVGQSQFAYIDTIQIRAPYYLFLGQLLHIITFGKLNALYLQHATVILTALIAIFLSYFLFTRLIPNLRWCAALFAFFYVSCPGVIGLIYRCDMYNSFMAVPYVPLIVYGLIRTHQKNDALSYVLTTMGLSLVWMCHPPIGLWMIIICVFFYLIQFLFVQKKLLGFCIMPLIFVVLNSWQFFTIFYLNLQQYRFFSLQISQHIQKVLRNDVVGAFFPVGWMEVGTAFLQLGYSLWLAILLGIVVGLGRQKTILIKCLLACIMLLIILLFPIPILNIALWSILPNNVLSLNIWPMQRLYIILAAFSCFVGILALRRLMGDRPKFQPYIVSILLLLFFWNMYQVHYFIHTGVPKGIDSPWIEANNLYLTPYGTIFSHDDTQYGNYEPALKNKLLNQQFIPIPEFDNLQILINECKKNPFRLPQGMKFNMRNLNFPLKIRLPKIEHFIDIKGRAKLQHLLLCLNASLNNGGLLVEIIGPQYASNTQINRGSNSFITMPLYNPNKEKAIYHTKEQGLSLYLAVRDSKEKNTIVEVQSVSLIDYIPEKLPIHVTSYTPYEAIITTKEKNTYLDMGKEFILGYVALVNGKKVSAFETKDHMLLIPIADKGVNHIKLTYVGTKEMKLLFFINIVAWIILLIFLLCIYYNKSHP